MTDGIGASLLMHCSWSDATITMLDRLTKVSWKGFALPFAALQYVLACEASSAELVFLMQAALPELGCTPCALPCQRPRSCKHPCPLPCHRGDCPRCEQEVRLPCHCTRSTISLACSKLQQVLRSCSYLPC